MMQEAGIDRTTYFYVSMLHRPFGVLAQTDSVEASQLNTDSWTYKTENLQQLNLNHPAVCRETEGS